MLVDFGCGFCQTVEFKEKEAKEYSILAKILFKVIDNGIKDRQGGKRRQDRDNEYRKGREMSWWIGRR